MGGGETLALLQLSLVDPEIVGRRIVNSGIGDRELQLKILVMQYANRIRVRSSLSIID